MPFRGSGVGAIAPAERARPAARDTSEPKKNRRWQREGGRRACSLKVSAAAKAAASSKAEPKESEEERVRVGVKLRKEAIDQADTGLCSGLAS